MPRKKTAKKAVGTMDVDPMGQVSVEEDTLPPPPKQPPKPTAASVSVSVSTADSLIERLEQIVLELAGPRLGPVHRAYLMGEMSAEDWKRSVNSLRGSAPR